MMVLNMGLSGLSHKKKGNVAVVLKKLKEGETHFQYKNVDANKWCLFKAFCVQSEAA